MSWLCLSLPSVVKKSLKCWIWSASSGFRLNSAGNSEIQYLEARTKEWKYVLYALHSAFTDKYHNILWERLKCKAIFLRPASISDIWALCCQVIFCNYQYHNSVILANLLLTKVKAYKIHLAHWGYKWENWAREREHGNPTMGSNQVMVIIRYGQARISAAGRFRM